MPAPEVAEVDYDELPPAKNGRRPELRESDATNLASIETGRHTLSHTRLSVWLACHRKFELSYLQRLELMEVPRYFTLGKAYQKAIEHGDPEVGVRFLNGFEPCEVCGGKGGIKFDERGQEFFDEDGVLPAKCCGGRGYIGEQLYFHTAEGERYHLINTAIVRAASKLYLKLWPAPLTETREFEYRVRLRSPWTGAYSNTYDLLGYADGVIDPLLGDWSGDGNSDADHSGVPLEVVENKLVGRIEKASVIALPLNRQLALERYGIWRATGRPVTRVWYRWMKKPSIEQKKGRGADHKGAETVEQYCERVEADYEARPEFYAREDDPDFVTTKDLLRVEADLWEIAADMRSYLHRGSDGRRRTFPRDTTRCSDFGGCDFLPICTGAPDAHAQYNVRPKRSAKNESAPEAE